MLTSRRNCLKTIVALGATTGLRTSWANRLAAGMRAQGSRKLIVLRMPGGP